MVRYFTEEDLRKMRDLVDTFKKALDALTSHVDALSKQEDVKGTTMFGEKPFTMTSPQPEAQKPPAVGGLPNPGIKWEATPKEGSGETQKFTGFDKESIDELKTRMKKAGKDILKYDFSEVK